MTTNAHSSAAAPSPFAPPPEVVEDAYSVPAFSPEDEQRERQSLTEEERRRIVADLCGLADGMAGLRVSTAGGAKMAVDGACNTKSEAAADKETLRTPEEIERDMNLLNAELDAIPQDEKEAYLLALLQCPHQLFGGWRGEVIVEMQQQEGAGGRGTVFDAKQTARKMVDYWQRRYEAFGEDLAFKPMTLAGAMEEELGTTADPDEADEGTPDPNPVFNMGNADDDGGEGIFFDACTLEFEFLCTGSSENEPTSFSYVFGSEDYFEFIDVENDQFRFLLNGVNIALLPNGDAVEIDAINEEDNPELFNKNAANEDDDVFEPLYNIEADGFTTVLTASGTCNATMNGGWNKMKLVIADEFDRGYDSWLLLGASSFVVGAPPSPSPSQMPSFAPSFAPTPVSTGTLTMRRTAPPSTMPSSEPTPDIGGDGEGVGAGQPTLQPSTIEVTGRNVVCPCRHDEE